MISIALRGSSSRRLPAGATFVTPTPVSRTEIMVPSPDDRTAPTLQGADQTRLAELERFRQVLATRYADARLTIELVPKTSWYSNVRSHVSDVQWDRLRKPVYQRARSRCEVCGGRGSRHPVECHEVWHYDDVGCVQRLVGLIALCPACHRVKHVGRAHLFGRGDEAIDHLMSVNGWTADEADVYIDLVFDIWSLRSQVPWRVDLSWLVDQGVLVPDASVHRDGPE